MMLSCIFLTGATCKRSRSFEAEYRDVAEVSPGESPRGVFLRCICFASSSWYENEGNHL